MEQALPTVLLSFVGTLLALVITKTVERAYLKHVEQAELSRDLIIHLANTLPAVERLIPELSRSFRATTRDGLRKYSSEFIWSKLPLSLEKLLHTFTSAKIHRLLINYFDRDALMRASSDENRAAFFWLLDSEVEDWLTRPSAVERLEAMTVARSRMVNYATEILKFGYGLLEELLILANDLPAYVLRGDFRELLHELQLAYGLTPDDVTRRRAFYTSTFDDGSVTIYERAERHVLLRVQAPATREVGACLRLSFTDGNGATRSIRMLPEDEIAIPNSWQVRAIEVQLRDSRQNIRQSVKSACLVVLENQASSIPYILTLPSDCSLLLQGGN